ncbi:MAG: S8 family serine peptidase [Deltaproteobacteria bacterium]|nr:S8 family serine peptidase [Deltaproteobacteria bacterium]
MSADEPLLLRALRSAPETLALAPLEPVTVAVLDSGIDGSHGLLRGRVVQSFSAVISQGRAVMEPTDPAANNDRYGHGTAVASILAKLAPNAKLVDLRVLGDRALGTSAALVAALKFAIEQRFSVINLSVAASSELAQSLHLLCERAYRQGQTVVAATRNMPLADHGYPAELSSVVSVDSVAISALYAVHYRRTHPIEYAAAGANIEVAAAGGGLSTATGSSFAAPTVSALCALWLGAFPGLRPFEIKSLLKAFALVDPVFDDRFSAL